MKTLKIVLSILCLVTISNLAHGQNCQGDKIRVFKGAIRCGCQCKKKCVSPGELQQYLDDGWNTYGCFNCCGWVDADANQTLGTEIAANESTPNTLIFPYDSNETNVTIQVMDMTGRYVETVVGEFSDGDDISFTWDDSDLNPGIYFLRIMAGTTLETKMISVID